MNLPLGQFQDAFIDALYLRPAPLLQNLTRQPAFAVYRNTLMAGCVDALRANFPSVETLVGADWMQQAAAAYAQHTPPDDARLIRYGATFAAFLQDSQASHGLPYLADVARLDWHWCEVFSAIEQPCLALADLAGMTASDLGGSHLRPRQNVRWQWFAANPALSLWRCSREGLPWPQSQPWVAEGALLSADQHGVNHQPLEAGGCMFLDACAAGHSLESASQLALQRQPDLDFTSLLGRLMQARVFLPLSFD
ncbi:HvfC/BufC N-terminal domain-containing protein [Pseudomonas sp. GD03746]|uniref:HvfC/BufC N-terminal domain-containing protein n=1 Tax=Pseudomonas sp. GD03746 TaxID=2975378 RepID=UPI00244B6D42|nr:DNA-binding domain-containing protein [Pseudomonas sp. GD03746]MDH1576310.1 DNA-binding domain-containing protein [Pseudomonas sp. GD03746]